MKISIKNIIISMLIGFATFGWGYYSITFIDDKKAIFFIGALCCSIYGIFDELINYKKHDN